MQDSTLCHNDELSIENPYYFEYLDQQYPFDLELFKHNSIVIQQMQDKIKANKKIPLISAKEKVNISKGSIEEFIKCCHFQNFTINNENVNSLQYLANKYKVPFLQKQTKEFISKNQDNFIFNDIQNFSKEKEKIVSNKLEKYINNDHLYEISIQSIRNIINNYMETFTANTKNDNEEEIFRKRKLIFDFYTKSFERKGADCKDLYKLLKISKDEPQYIKQLISLFNKHQIEDTDLIKKDLEIQTEENQFLRYVIGHRNATDIQIPKCISNISGSLFSDFKNLRRIKLPFTIITIENKAFQKCISLLSISIPSSVISIGDYVFDSCISLKEVSIPSSVKTIGNFAFANCSKLTKISMNPFLIQFGEDTFKNCFSLKHLVFLSSTDTIQKFDFGNFDTISFVPQVPLKIIDNGAFASSLTLVEVHIPPSVTTIGNNAF